MARRHDALVVAGLAALAVMTAPAGVAGAPATWRHSGCVVAVGPHSIVVAEVGPWRVRAGETVLTERRIEIARATEFVLAQRVADAPSGFPGDFVEEPLVDWRLVRGDHVTVECVHRGARMIAVKVTVLNPGARE